MNGQVRAPLERLFPKALPLGFCAAALGQSEEIARGGNPLDFDTTLCGVQRTTKCRRVSASVVVPLVLAFGLALVLVTTLLGHLRRAKDEDSLY